MLLATDLTLVTTYLGGAERDDDSRTLRHPLDLPLTSKLTSRPSLGASSGLGRDGGARWFGAAGYARLQLTPMFATAIRGELFDDPQGVRTTTRQHLYELTLTPALRVAPGLVLRGEL